MDPDRQIRFLYPPLFFVASIAWGLRLDPSRWIGDIVPLSLFKESGSAILAVVAGGGVVVAALGLLINTIPWMLFRIIALARGEQSHEAVLSSKGLERIRNILGYRFPQTQEDALFLVATFDHRAFMNPFTSGCFVDGMHSTLIPRSCPRSRWPLSLAGDSGYT
jgi:hypothetical protein